MGIEYYSFALFIAVLVCIIAILFKILFSGVKQQRKLLDEKEKNLLQLYQTVESVMDDFNNQVEAAMDDIKEYENRAAAYRAAHAMLTSVELAPKIVTDAEESPKPEIAKKPEPVSREGSNESSVIRAAGEALERAERMMKPSVGKQVDYVLSDEQGDESDILSSIAAGSPSKGKSKSGAKSSSKTGGKSGSKGSAKSGAGGNVVIQRLFDDASDEEPSDESHVQTSSNRKSTILSLSEEGKTHAQIAKELGITQNEVKLVIELGKRQ